MQFNLVYHFQKQFHHKSTFAIAHSSCEHFKKQFTVLSLCKHPAQCPVLLVCVPLNFTSFTVPFVVRHFCNSRHVTWLPTFKQLFFAQSLISALTQNYTVFVFISS